MFKKQDEGKFEQISEFSLSKSLASKLEMPCEWVVTNICLFFCECQPWPNSRQVSASEPAAASRSCAEITTEVMPNYCFLTQSA